MSTVLTALDRLRRDRVGRWTTGGGVLVLLPLYGVVLPAALTGGKVGWHSLAVLSPGLGLLAFGLSVTLALTLGLMTLLVRDGRRATKSAATGGALMALITPLLCCGPILPLALGGLALVFPALASAAAGRVQGFIATHETAILSLALGLCILAFYQNARRVAAGPACRP